jgi:hypothetical protein
LEEELSTQYPSEREESGDEIRRLNEIVKNLEERNKQLNVELMRKSAEASEAKEILKRWRTELGILADQKGHNLCHIGIPKLLKATLGYHGTYPDPENITAEEFARGCVAYHRDLFGNCGVGLTVLKTENKQKE